MSILILLVKSIFKNCFISLIYKFIKNINKFKNNNVLITIFNKIFIII